MSHAFQVVNDFEAAIAKYSGSRFAVAVDSCSSALFLCCRYLSVGTVYLPRTYCSVPAAVLHAGGRVEWENRPWSGEYRLDPYPIIDGAGRLRRGMHTEGTYRCISTHWTKLLPCGKGGVILHDDPAADEWFRRARYSGRHDCGQFQDPGFVLAGWNFYMDPATASRGMTLLTNLADDNPDIRTHESYPDCSQNPIYTAPDSQTRYALPEPYDVRERWTSSGLTFRPITEADAENVCRWRNANTAFFFDPREITPEDHRRFLDRKSPNDHVWIVEDGGVVGMASLTIDGSTAEYGRLLIEPTLKGRGYGERIERAVMRHGLTTLGLNLLWGEYLKENEPIAKLHRKTGWRVVRERAHERGTVVVVEYP